MIKKILNVSFSLQTTVVLALVFLIAQAYATFLPKMEIAWDIVYGKFWFEFIMWLLAINLIGVLIKYKTYKKPPVFTLHLAVLIILLGAAITRYFGYEGQLYLRNGETKCEILVIKDKAHPSDVYQKKPDFCIKLDKFVMHKYPGSMMPSSYDSFIRVIDNNKSFKYHIYMNHILVYKGYRFYQASYFPDERGSILSVNHDPGMWITYLGYLLLAIGFFWSMFYKKSNFMKTVRNLKNSGLFAFLLVLMLPSFSKAMDLATFKSSSLKVSDEWSKVLVQKMGRIEPMDTLDLDIVHKLTLKSRLHGLTYNQIVVGILTYPEVFEKLPLIYVGHPKIRKILGIKGKYASFVDFLNPDGSFKFAKEIEKIDAIPDKNRNVLQREYLKLGERFFIYETVEDASIFNLFPTPKAKMMNYKWFSVSDIQNSIKMGLMSPMDAQFYYNLFKELYLGLKAFDVQKTKEVREKIYELQKTYSGDIIPSWNKIEWEIKYNRMQIFPKLIGIYTLLGLVAIMLGFIEILKQKRFVKTENVIVFLGVLALLLHTANMILRWYVAGHAPWSDAYESIIFIAWGSAFASLLFFRKSMLALGAGLFVAGMFMMVAHLNNISPQITNMVPVLKSYWLLIHVAVITSSYGFLGVGSMLGFLNLILFALRKKYPLEVQIKQLNNIIYIALYIGLALLSIGTFLGGIWANESWGRYWSWDPKETWSLISMIVYALVIHTKMIPQMRGQFIFALLSFLSFFFILMTYFGVNFYIAQGLHSYGQGVADGYGWIRVIFAGMGAWIAVVFVSLFISIVKNTKDPMSVVKINESNEYHPEYKDK
ncbi:MAG: cytochrome c biogenesis protein CcsA [Nautiliaceae bacterium]